MNEFYNIRTLDNDFCKRIYFNTQMLANYYDISSPVFELFAIAQNNTNSGLEFIEGLYSDDLLNLSDHDYKKLHFACKNISKPIKNHILSNDLVVQICLDAVLLDECATSSIVKLNRLNTGYARNICRENMELEKLEVSSVYMNLT